MGDQDAIQEPKPRTRILSLDALRGFDMLWIMGADAIGGALLAVGESTGASEASPGTQFSGFRSLIVKLCHFLGEQLEHVPWEGFLFYDLIFPMFLFIIGTSLVFSLDKIRAERGFDAAFVRVIKRTILLYALGIFYYGGWGGGLDQIRLLGVLQRLAICYGISATLYLWCRPTTWYAVCLVILLGYWALLALAPVPGVGPASYDEGINFTNWFDSRFLPFRKWDGEYDPEGILSTFPAIVSCLLGVFAGCYLRDTKSSPNRQAATLVCAGLALVAVGYVWGLAFPVIKKLWTSSYVLIAGGWSAVLLGTFYYLIDVRGWSRGFAMFVWIGLNPIALYMLGNLVDFNHFARRFVGGGIEGSLDGWLPGFGGLLVAIMGIGWGVVAAWWLHKRRIYFRL